MTTIGWVQILLYCAIIIAITPVLGGYMLRVLQRRTHFPFPDPAAGRRLWLYWAGGC